MSHEIITEQIVLMGQRLLQSLLQQVQQSSPAWYALMGDEATVVANMQRVVECVYLMGRWCIQYQGRSCWIVPLAFNYC